jgi:sulfur-oxidizing protein SoxX
MTRRIIVASSAVVLAACATGPAPVTEQPKLTEAEYAQLTAAFKSDFRPRGQAKMDRLEPDAVQRTCNLYADQPPEAVAKPLEKAQLDTVKYPSGSLLGDWKSGARIADSGRGMQWSEKPGSPGGGGCYNCHELSPKQESHGTLGPSLVAFGKTRGYGPDIQRYVYAKIYNAKAFNLCSHMPRFGHTGSLTEQQMKDVTAYLLDPNSPVNK